MNVSVDKRPARKTAVSITQPSPPRRPPAPDTNNNVHVDRVNGIGMWRSWTRSFNTPLLALLDLFDNAVDASMKRNGGSYESPKIVVNIDDIGGGGILIRNSCESPIPPMKQVLEVYKSSKNNAAIGENGIGVKHACANLSTLSILLSKTTSVDGEEDRVSMGIVMEELQKAEGVILPSACFDATDNLQAELHEKVQEFPNTWGVALTAYGEGNLEVGMDRILVHFQQMTQHWKDYDHVFTTLITKLRHRGHKEDSHEHHDDSDADDDDSVHRSTRHYMEQGDNNQWRSMLLLQELRDKLPKLYIHIHNIDVSVQHQPIDNLYWERRLVELTQFEIPINPKVSWKKDPFVFDLESQEAIHKIPKIRFLLGFDPYRAREKKQSESACRMLLYSRESGRLIKEFEDARAMLNLVAGSTDYTQGLTVLLDDIDSTLPLNPTKQDLAFGFTEHGQTHRLNVMEWTGAVANFYWQYHFDRLGGKKSILTKSVLKSGNELDQIFQNPNGDPPRVPPLSSAEYTYFRTVDWRSKYDKIRVQKQGRVDAVPTFGRDSLVRLTLPPAPAPKRKQAPRKVPVKAHSRNIGGANLVNGARAAASKPGKYSEDDDEYFDGDDDDEDDTGRASKRPRINGNDNTAFARLSKQWQDEKKDLETQIHEKDVFLAKILKDKQEEARQRSIYQQERNQLEEQVENLEYEKEQLQDKLSKSHGDLHKELEEATKELNLVKFKLEKRTTKYHNMKMGFTTQAERIVLLEQELATLKAGNNTPLKTENGGGVTVSDATASPAASPPTPNHHNAMLTSPTATTPNIEGEEALRAHLRKAKMQSERNLQRTHQLEKRIDAMRTTISTLEEENTNLSKQLEEREENTTPADNNSSSSSSNQAQAPVAPKDVIDVDQPEQPPPPPPAPKDNFFVDLALE